jgi:hypothetical protein
MFNNCVLPADADAELHKLLAFISARFPISAVRRKDEMT